MNQFTILERNGDKILVSMDVQLWDQVLQFLQQITQQQIENTTFQSFLRRVVPFFMNQFKYWAQQQQLKPVVKWLKMIQSVKKSKQHKFELGDLKALFSKQNLQLKSDQAITQYYWKEFLQVGAEKSVLKNMKIRELDTKIQYINTIPLLLGELDQLSPYDRLLSKYRVSVQEEQQQFQFHQFQQEQNEFCGELIQEDSDITFFK